jgi:integrase
VTRYPKAGKGHKWTVRELLSITHVAKGDTLSDSEGLVGDVRINKQGTVSIAFKYGFKWQGNKVWHYCGVFPSTDIKAIREIRDAAKSQIALGIDPRAKKIADRIDAQAAVDAKVEADIKQRKDNLSFIDLYDAWIADGVRRKDDNKAIAQLFKSHALPSLAPITLKQLSENDLRSVYRGIISQGKERTAVMLSKDIKQMLRWAEKRQPWRKLLAEGNPAELVEIKKLVSSDYTEERNRILSNNELKQLKTILATITKDYEAANQKYAVQRPLKKETEIALWLCLSSLCRIGELLLTEWKHIDFNARTWFIPKKNVKGENSRKSDQLIFLSDFALAQFQALHLLTGHTLWAFPSRDNINHVCLKSISKQVGDRQTKFKKRTKNLSRRVNNNSLVVGEQDWTPHDLRRTGSTMMQTLKIPREIINLCQNHAVGSSLDRHYLLHEFEDEKKEAWAKLGKQLEQILTAA